jgi:hypothetical protein
VSAGDSEFLTWSLHVPFFCQNNEKSCTWGVPSLSPRAPAGRRDARRPPPGTTVACGGGGVADACVQESKRARQQHYVPPTGATRSWHTGDVGAGEESTATEDARATSTPSVAGGTLRRCPLVSKLAGVASPELHPRIFWSFNPTVGALLANRRVTIFGATLFGYRLPDEHQVACP